MKGPTMRLRPVLIAGIAATTLSLAACDRSPPTPPPAENDAMVEPEPTPPPAEPVPQVVELPKAEAPPKPKPAPEVSADQQVLDDADATGMTARVARDGDGGSDDSQPASGGGNSQD